MNAVRAPSMHNRWAEAPRWAICLVLALGFHAAALMARWNDSSDLVASAPVIMLELAPVAAAPDITPNDLPPDTQLSKQAEPEPQPETPVEKIEAPPAPQAELQVIPPPKLPEKPKDKKPKQKHASVASAPSSAEQRSERAVAPMPGTSSPNSNAIRNWHSQLVAQIERHKHFSGADRGVVQVAFSVDRSGGVHHTRIVRSSGSSVLDHDALAWVGRAQPMPPPPADVSGAQIPVVVPLRYNYR